MSTPLEIFTLFWNLKTENIGFLMCVPFWFAVFGPIKNPAVFKKVSLDNDAGTISWFGGVDIDPDVLYALSVQLELPMEASR